MNNKDKLEQEYLVKAKKPRMSLLPSELIIEVIKVIEYGVTKYEENDWKKKVIEDPNIFFDAGYRHLFNSTQGKILDEESGLYHLAHASTNSLYLLWAQLQKEKGAL